MQVSDAMTRTVRATTPDQTVASVAQTLLDWDVSGLPVVGKDMEVVGIVTEGDLLRRPESQTTGRPSWLRLVFSSGTELARDYIKSHARLVADAMTAPAVTIDESASLAEAAELMAERQVKRLPVVAGNRLVGMLSRSDVLRTWVRSTRALQSLPSDVEIRAKILAAIEQEPWVTAARVNATVEDGKVEIWGMVEGATEKKALELLASRQPGVRGVESHVMVRTSGLIGV